MPLGAAANHRKAAQLKRNVCPKLHESASDRDGRSRHCCLLVGVHTFLYAMTRTTQFHCKNHQNFDRPTPLRHLQSTGPSPNHSHQNIHYDRHHYDTPPDHYITISVSLLIAIISVTTTHHHHHPITLTIIINIVIIIDVVIVTFSITITAAITPTAGFAYTGLGRCRLLSSMM